MLYKDRLRLNQGQEQKFVVPEWNIQNFMVNLVDIFQVGVHAMEMCSIQLA